ncbi:MAG: transcriptional regulator [Tepidisphaeraceae bacterium]|jgi:HTH-type transcriptional regulator/antitoxin HigA
MSTTATKGDICDTYLDLVRAFPLRGIRSEREFDKAVAMLLKLEISKPESEWDAGERDYIEMLAMLVQRYEQGRRTAALPATTPVDRLRFLMGERGMNVSDLGRVIGNQPSASLILHGKRSMSKAQIVKLARHFAVSPALFMEM